MEAIWQEMRDAAMKVIRPREVSGMVEVGGIAAAVESASGKIYVGVCVDTACTLGVCAERNAMFNMITNGEDEIRRVVAVNREGNAVPPCGACREFMAQLMQNKNGDSAGLGCRKDRHAARFDAGMVAVKRTKKEGRAAPSVE